MAAIPEPPRRKSPSARHSRPCHQVWWMFSWRPWPVRGCEHVTSVAVWNIQFDVGIITCSCWSSVTNYKQNWDNVSPVAVDDLGSGLPRVSTCVKPPGWVGLWLGNVTKQHEEARWRSKKCLWMFLWLCLYFISLLHWKLTCQVCSAFRQDICRAHDKCDTLGKENLFCVI